MGDMIANSEIKNASISAVIIRADGSREDLGVIAEYHRNPIRRALAAVKKEIVKWRP
jgi:hypothetical protein